MGAMKKSRLSDTIIMCRSFLNIFTEMTFERINEANKIIILLKYYIQNFPAIADGGDLCDEPRKNYVSAVPAIRRH